MERKERKKDVFLTYVQQQEILRRGHRAGETYESIAAKYNVSRNVVGQLFRRQKKAEEKILLGL